MNTIPQPGMPQPQPGVVPVTQPVAQPVQPNQPAQPVAQPVPAPVGMPAQPVQQTLTPAPVYPQQAVAPAAGMVNAAPQQAITNTVDSICQQVANAKISEQRNSLPLGSAIYAINNVAYKLSPTQKKPMDSMSLICLVPIKDAAGFAFGDPGYAGAVPGQNYEYAIFRNSQYGSHVSRWLDVVACFAGYSPEVLKGYQSTPEGRMHITQLIQVYFGWDFTTNQPTQSCLSNMFCAEIATVKNIKPKKDKQTKQPMYDANGQPIMSEFINTYFNRNVPLAEVLPLYQGKEDQLYSCFGGYDNFMRAWNAQAATQ